MGFEENFLVLTKIQSSLEYELEGEEKPILALSYFFILYHHLLSYYFHYLLHQLIPLLFTTIWVNTTLTGIYFRWDSNR